MEYKIIDSHAHIFPNKIANRASSNISDFYDLDVRFGGTVAELLKCDEKASVKEAIVNSTATIPQQVESINRFVKKACDNHKELHGLITLHPDMKHEDMDREIKYAKDNGLIGIKLHPDFQKFMMDDKKLDAIYHRAAEAKLTILMHCGDRRYNRSHPHKLSEVARRFPDLIFVGAHFGGWSQWQYIDCYEETPNVFFDTSSTFEFLDKELVLAMMYKLGIQRLMFGTDYPMWDTNRELELLFSYKLTEQENQAILYDNAKRIYKF